LNRLVLHLELDVPRQALTGAAVSDGPLQIPMSQFLRQLRHYPMPPAANILRLDKQRIRKMKVLGNCQHTSDSLFACLPERFPQDPRARDEYLNDSLR
jgi:hypothetical protein